MTEQTCPPLPAGSIDMNALHAAARQNHDLPKAIAEMIADPVEQPEATAPAPADDPSEAQPVAEAVPADDEPAAPKRGK